MSRLKEITEKRPRITGAALWLLAAVVTIACFAFQDKTGPTQPLEGSVDTQKGAVRFKFLRSENIGTDLAVMLVDPVPQGIEASVRYRRFMSDDEWKTVAMTPREVEYTRRGSKSVMKGVGALLPSLTERAGKYEFFVEIKDGDNKPVSVTGDRAVLARYKGAVPVWALFAHIFAIFASMTIAMRTTLAAVVDGKMKGLIWATMISLTAGAFVLGPLIQWYAFGVWWSGIPFGYDWTDNKVLLEVAFWIPALILNRGDKRNRLSVLLAGAVTIAIYFIPHSIFGSQYNYKTGSGHGTAG